MIRGVAWRGFNVLCNVMWRVVTCDASITCCCGLCGYGKYRYKFLHNIEGSWFSRSNDKQNKIYIRNQKCRRCRLLDDRGTGQLSVANMGAFLLEVYNTRGLACRELARLQDLIEEAGMRRPEDLTLDLSDFKVRRLVVLVFSLFLFQSGFMKLKFSPSACLRPGFWELRIERWRDHGNFYYWGGGVGILRRFCQAMINFSPLNSRIKVPRSIRQLVVLKSRHEYLVIYAKYYFPTLKKPWGNFGWINHWLW